MKIKIYLISNQLFSNSQKSFELEDSKKIGEKIQDKIIYTPFEALYLVEEKKAEFIYKNKKISNIDVKNLLAKEKKFISKYLVFKDLKKKGYIVKTGLKFGTEFRVYKENSKHSQWLVYPINQTEKLNIKEFVAINRIAHSTRKKIILAVIDLQEDINYYEVNWTKLK